MIRKYWVRWTALCLFTVLGLWSYHRALSSEFILDDVVRIAIPHVENGRVVFSALPAYSRGLGAAITEILPDRPLLILTLWANHELGGSDPFLYKLFNVLLHIVNSIFVSALLLDAARFFGKRRDPWIALLLGLIFLLHPLNNQAVTMVVQRGVLLAFFFGMLSLRYGMRHLEEGRRIDLVRCAAFFFLSILCKPNALVLLPLLWLFANFSGRLARLRPMLGPLAAALLFPLAVYTLTNFNQQPGSGDARHWWQYLLIQNGVILHYLRQVVWPFGFNAFYDIPLRPQVTSASFLLAAAFHLAILGWGASRARRGSLAGFGVCAFYIGLLPESSVFPIRHVVFDHRMYFPFPFLLLSVYGLLTDSLPRLEAPKAHKLILLALGLVALFLGKLNDGRNREIGTYLDWLTTTSTKFPQDESLQTTEMYLLLELKDWQEGARRATVLAQANPRRAEFPLYRSIFLGEENAEAKIREGLVSPQANSIEEFSRLAFNRFLLQRWRSAALGLPAQLSQIALSEEIHDLLYAQRRHFLRGNPYLAPLANDYLRNLKDLHAAYGEACTAGLVSLAQFERWSAVAQDLATAQPGFLERFSESSGLPGWTCFLAPRVSILSE